MKLACCTAVILSFMAAVPAFSGKLDLRSVAAATTKYRDPEIARADGYIELPKEDCVTAAAVGEDPELGAIGKLFVHPERLNLYAVGRRVTTNRAWTNWVDPGVLIYEPNLEEGLTLVGIANIVSPQGWAGNGFVTEPITEGRVWSLVKDDPSTEVDEAYGFAPHFTLRIWLFRHNPAGVFSDFNSAVNCVPVVGGTN